MTAQEREIVMKPNTDDIRKHLTALFDGMGDYDDGRIEISILNQSETFERTDIDAAIAKAVQWNEQGKNVYTVGSLLDPDVAPFGRSSDTDFYATSVIWCDIDREFDPAQLKGAYSKCPPTMSVITGRTPHTRAHLWWKLSETCTDAAKVRLALTGIQQALGGDAAVKNVASLMRIGGSVAWPKKDGRVVELTQVKGGVGDVVSDIDAFISHYPASDVVASTSLTPANRNIFTGTYDIQGLLENTRESGEWNRHMLMAVGSMVGKGWNNEQILVACAPYADGGSNDSDVIGIINRTRAKFGEPEPVVVANTQEPKEKKGMYLVKASDMNYEPDENDFVQGLLETGAMSVVYGESNCGKTFFMSDLAYHIAEGKPWRGKRVEKGGVIYVPLEGTRGLTGRVQAYRNENNTDIDGFNIMPCGFDFLDEEGDVAEFIELLGDIDDIDGGIKIIIIDTLARAIGGGDENSGQDMGLLVKHADAIRSITGAHICFIHHSGKDKAKGARGHSSLRAAVDTEIEIDREDGADFSTVKIVKQREMEMGEDMFFTLKSVTLGVNKYNEEKKSCVVVETEGQTKEKVFKLNPVQTFLYNNLVRALDDYGQVRRFAHGSTKCVTYDELRTVMEENGFKEMMATANKTTAQQVKSTTQTARLQLQKMNKISFDGMHIWLMDEGDLQV